MSNRLAQETSPYLQQHANNPVDWYPWGEEALAEAKRTGKPILLSVGYSACHWCHVMAHESFEDEATAAYMNEHFVNIKVDREERPDVDAVYMEAVQAMTGHGGWPMTSFLTPKGEPFFCGTYWPDVPKHGMPSFLQVLESIARTWDEKRSEVLEAGADVVRRLSASGPVGRSAPVTPHLLDTAASSLRRQAWITRRSKVIAMALKVTVRSASADHSGCRNGARPVRCCRGTRSARWSTRPRRCWTRR